VAGARPFEPSDDIKQATTNTGILHCVQDDDEKKATTNENRNGKGKISSSKQATAAEKQATANELQLVGF
jgi:hypothetical protein